MYILQIVLASVLTLPSVMQAIYATKQDDRICTVVQISKNVHVYNSCRL